MHVAEDEDHLVHQRAQGASGEVGGHDHVVEGPEGVTGRERLVAEDVEGGPEDRLRCQV